MDRHYPEQANRLDSYVINRHKMNSIFQLCGELSYLYAEGVNNSTIATFRNCIIVQLYSFTMNPMKLFCFDDVRIH